MADFAWVCLGVLGLWLGTEAVVRAGGVLGRCLGLSEMFLGLTVFAIGTDLSELLVAIDGSIRQYDGADSSGLIVGNALGSVLAQGALVLGVVTLFERLGRSGQPAPAGARVWDAAVWLGAVALLGLVASDLEITPLEGGLLCIVYLTYLGILIKRSRAVEKFRSGNRSTHFAIPLVALLVGFAIVAASADIAVEHGLALAEQSGVDPTAIGLFGIGVGTSLPELAVSIGAIARGRPSLSIGNILGSNTFDLLVPMGAAALIHPVAVERNSLYFDLPAIGLLALYFGLRLATRGRLDARDAIGLFGFYVAFLLFRVGTFVG